MDSCRIRAFNAKYKATGFSIVIHTPLHISDLRPFAATEVASLIRAEVELNCQEEVRAD